jgi:hypothetical protein
LLAQDEPRWLAEKVVRVDALPRLGIVGELLRHSGSIQDRTNRCKVAGSWHNLEYPTGLLP